MNRIKRILERNYYRYMQDVCSICVFREHLHNTPGSIEIGLEKGKKPDAYTDTEKPFSILPHEERILGTSAE